MHVNVLTSTVVRCRSYVGRGGVFKKLIGKCLFKISTDKVVDLIEASTGLCALDSEISRKKLLFNQKLSCSSNPVIEGLARLNL